MLSERRARVRGKKDEAVQKARGGVTGVEDDVGFATTCHRGRDDGSRGNEGKGRRRRMHAHGQAVGEQTDLLAVGQYSDQIQVQRNGVTRRARMPRTTGQRLKCRRCPYQRCAPTRAHSRK